MRSGLYLTCGLILLGGCAHSNGFQSAGRAAKDPAKFVTKAPKTKPIQLVANPRGQKPVAGTGYGNPWQSKGQNRADFDSNASVPFETDDGVQHPPPFQNAVSQVRRTNRPTTGYSAPSDRPAWNSARPQTSLNNELPAKNVGYSSRSTLQDSSNYRMPPEYDHGSGVEQAGRRVINPPDWNPGAMVAPQIRMQDYTYQSGGGTNFRVSPVPTVRGFSQPIQQSGFDNFSPSDSAVEIPLRPGQALPGFTNQRVRTPQYDESESRRPLPITPRPSTSGEQSSLRSPADALKLVTAATEREVATLSPGQTVAELQYYIERHVYLRLLYQMAGKTEWALRPIPNIPAADQEFWTQVLWGVHSYFDIHQVPDPTERAAQTIAQFNTAILRLKERAPLELKNVIFSYKIDGFGEYETYPKDEFAPGQRVLVYAEIGNFHSELTAEGHYRTRLKSALQFFSADSPHEPLESKSYPVTEDFCRNHRHDYFHSYVVDIPARCGKGRHVLKLLIEDELSGKTAEYPLQFNVR